MARVMLIGLDTNAISRLAPILKDARCALADVPDQQGALELALTWQPDLAVVEVGNSTVAGVGIASLRVALKAPLIAIGLAGEDERTAALERGADDCLSGPLDPLELAARILVILRRHLPAGAEDFARPLHMLAHQSDGQAHPARSQRSWHRGLLGRHAWR